MPVRFPLTGCAAAAFALAFGAVSANAAQVFTYSSQNREVMAFAGVNGVGPDKVVVVAPDFTPFQGDAIATIGTAPVISTVEATQNSTLGPGAISASGVLTVTGGAGTAGAADSICNVIFSVASETSFNLSGQATGPFPSQSATGTLDVSLTAADGTNIFSPLQTTLANDPLPIRESGDLAPGTYTLMIHESDSATASPGNASFNLNMTGTSIAAVPLPSAFCGGGALLTLIAATSLPIGTLMRGRSHARPMGGNG